MSICSVLTRNKVRKKVQKYGYLFSTISIVGLILFYLFPFISGVIHTVFQAVPEMEWKGLGIYIELIQSATFRQALCNTFCFIGIGLPILLFFTIVLSYMIDELVRKNVKGVSVWIALHLLPMILPSIIITKIIKLFFADFGVINGYLLRCNLEPVRWLSSGWTFWLLCLIFWWKNTGYSMVVLFSGMQNIEKEQREAASLEGAGEVRIYLQIVLPQLVSFLRFVIIMGVVGIFKLYKESYLLLGSSPCDEAYMLQNFLNNNFASLNFDRTMSASVILFILISIFLLLLFSITERYKNKR